MYQYDNSNYFKASNKVHTHQHGSGCGAESLTKLASRSSGSPSGRASDASSGWSAGLTATALSTHNGAAAGGASRAESQGAAHQAVSSQANAAASNGSTSHSPTKSSAVPKSAVTERSQQRDTAAPAWTASARHQHGAASASTMSSLTAGTAAPVSSEGGVRARSSASGEATGVSSGSGIARADNPQHSSSDEVTIRKAIEDLRARASLLEICLEARQAKSGGDESALAAAAAGGTASVSVTAAAGTTSIPPAAPYAWELHRSTWESAPVVRPEYGEFHHMWDPAEKCYKHLHPLPNIDVSQLTTSQNKVLKAFEDRELFDGRRISRFLNDVSAIMKKLNVHPHTVAAMLLSGQLTSVAVAQRVKRCIRERAGGSDARARRARDAVLQSDPTDMGDSLLWLQDVYVFLAEEFFADGERWTAAAEMRQAKLFSASLSGVHGLYQSLYQLQYATELIDAGEGEPGSYMDFERRLREAVHAKSPDLRRRFDLLCVHFGVSLGFDEGADLVDCYERLGDATRQIAALEKKGAATVEITVQSARAASSKASGAAKASIAATRSESKPPSSPRTAVPTPPAEQRQDDASASVSHAQQSTGVSSATSGGQQLRRDGSTCASPATPEQPSAVVRSASATASSVESSSPGAGVASATVGSASSTQASGGSRYRTTAAPGWWGQSAHARATQPVAQQQHLYSGQRDQLRGLYFWKSSGVQCFGPFSDAFYSWPRQKQDEQWVLQARYDRDHVEYYVDHGRVLVGVQLEPYNAQNPQFVAEQSRLRHWFEVQEQRETDRQIAAAQQLGRW